MRLIPTLAALLMLTGLQGCAVGTVVGAGVGVAATGVKAGAKVVGTTVEVAADGVGAAGRAATRRKR